jgi:hypothetical protein
MVDYKTRKSVITADLYNNSFYSHKGSIATRMEKIKSSRKDIVVSYVANRDLITEIIELSSNLPENDIKDIVTNKVYDELRLDTATDYGVYPIKTAMHSQLNKYQTLIVDKNYLKERFKKIAKVTKNIDYLIPAPLLYKVLYQERMLDSKSTDMFIYFGDYDCFITFYYKGEYLYSKSIKFSLDNMYDRFCQLAQEVPITKEKFKELIVNNGLRADDNKYRELIVRVVNECFLNINEILVYTKRTYDIADIKNTFIGFSWGYIDGIELYSKNYLNLDSKPIVSLYSKKDPKYAVDPIHYLMNLSAQDAELSVVDLPNLTPYPKPQPLLKRPAGSIMLAVGAISALFMLPIAYDYIVGLSYNGKNLILQDQEQQLAQEASRYKTALSKKREEIKALDGAIEKVSKVYSSKKGELDKVYEKKVNYSLRSEQLALIAKVLKEYDISSKDIVINDNEYLIELESASEKQITSLVKEVVNRFNEQIKSIDVKSINYDKKENIYKALLNISFKEEIK